MSKIMPGDMVTASPLSWSGNMSLWSDVDFFSVGIIVVGHMEEYELCFIVASVINPYEKRNWNPVLIFCPKSGVLGWNRSDNVVKVT